MKRVSIIIALCIISIMTIAQAKPKAKTQSTEPAIFLIAPEGPQKDKDFSANPMGWFKGKIIASDTQLTLEDAQAISQGTKKDKKIKIFTDEGRHEVDSKKYKYIYVPRLMNGKKSPNTDMKEYILNDQNYHLTINYDEPGIG